MKKIIPPTILTLLFPQFAFACGFVATPLDVGMNIIEAVLVSFVLYHLTLRRTLEMGMLRAFLLSFYVLFVLYYGVVSEVLTQACPLTGKEYFLNKLGTGLLLVSLFSFCVLLLTLVMKNIKRRDMVIVATSLATSLLLLSSLCVYFAPESWFTAFDQKIMFVPQ